jgi:hypothetical protein
MVAHRSSDEEMKAWRRIGETPAKAIHWLLAFARRDLAETALSVGDWANLQQEVTAFRNYGFLPAHAKDPYEHTSLTGSHRQQPMTKEQAREVQTWTRAMIEGVTSKEGMITFDFPAGRRHLVYLRKSGWSEWGTSEEPTAPFAYAMFRLVRLFADRLRECPAPDCPRKVFLAYRGNKKFCSLQCQTREAMRSYREAHGLMTGRKRGRPSKKKAQVNKGRDER